MPPVPADSASIERAGAIIRSGGLVAFPTETVYGLGADATNGAAVARIFEAKGRPRFNPLIVHVATLDQARCLATFSALAERLAAAFWPGPLTLVLPRRGGSELSELVTAGLDSVGLRMPGHDVARALIAAAGKPLAAPSANRSGHVSPTTAAHVADDLAGRVDMILDGGACRHGVESTVVTADGESVALLRPGAIAAADIERVCGVALRRALDGGDAPVSPGQLASHYAPHTRLIMNVTSPQQESALLAFGARVPDHTGPVINLSASGDLIEAAARLFSALRELDSAGAGLIEVMPIPDDGLGEAINDRLRRAAADR